MTYDNDPPRLRATGDPDDPFVQALEAARDDLPTDEQLARVAARLAPLGGAAPARGFLSLRARLRAKSVQAAAVALAAAVGVGATMKLKNVFPFMNAPSAVVSPAPLERSETPKARPVTEAKHGNAPVVSPSVEEPAAAPPESSSKAHAPSSIGSPHRPTASNGESDRPSQADLPSSDLDGPVSPENETALLGRAHQAVASNPARALALTEEHRRAYPAGVLGQESDVIAIEALVAMGRNREARTRADTFRARYPSSAHLRRIDRLLGDSQSAPSPNGGQ